MSCPRGMDSVDIHILEIKSSWWHWRQANDAIGSEQNIFCEKNQHYKSFLHVVMNPNVPIFWDLDVCGGRKLITYTQTHTQDNYCMYPSLCMHIGG